MQWFSPQRDLRTAHYVCGYCGSQVASRDGYRYGTGMQAIYICPCEKPTHIDVSGCQYPGAPFGERVDHLPEDVENLYDEARSCMQVSAYTCAVMACRKLLMNVAVGKGAEEGRDYVYYVNYLDEERHITRDARGSVDHIRKMGNSANHEIAPKSREDAERLITFVSMLLKLVFEFPEAMKTSASSTKTHRPKADRE